MFVEPSGGMGGGWVPPEPRMRLQMDEICMLITPMVLIVLFGTLFLSADTAGNLRMASTMLGICKLLAGAEILLALKVWLAVVSRFEKDFITWGRR